MDTQNLIESYLNSNESNQNIIEAGEDVEQELDREIARARRETSVKKSALTVTINLGQDGDDDTLKGAEDQDEAEDDPEGGLWSYGDCPQKFKLFFDLQAHVKAVYGKDITSKV